MVWQADVDGNGTLDYFYDGDQDGNPEAALMDDNGNQRFERIALFNPRLVAIGFDTDENGYFEAIGLDLDSNGLAERVLLDADQDRWSEWQMLDLNPVDGTADTWVRTDPTVGTAQSDQAANDLMVRNMVTLNQMRQLDPFSLGYIPYDPAPSLLQDQYHCSPTSLAC